MNEYPRRTPKGDAMLAALVSGGGAEYLEQFREQFKQVYREMYKVKGMDHPALDGSDEELREYLIQLLMKCNGKDKA